MCSLSAPYVLPIGSVLPISRGGIVDRRWGPSNPSSTSAPVSMDTHHHSREPPAELPVPRHHHYQRHRNRNIAILSGLCVMNVLRRHSLLLWLSPSSLQKQQQ